MKQKLPLISAKKTAKMKAAYGENQAGQRLLMARRLVEAGCRLVTLTYGGWDMHTGINAAMKRNHATS